MSKDVHNTRLWLFSSPLKSLIDEQVVQSRVRQLEWTLKFRSERSWNINSSSKSFKNYIKDVWMFWNDWVNFTMENVWKRETETKFHIISRLVTTYSWTTGQTWQTSQSQKVRSKITPPKYQEQLRHTIPSRIFIT